MAFAFVLPLLLPALPCLPYIVWFLFTPILWDHFWYYPCLYLIFCLMLALQFFTHTFMALFAFFAFLRGHFGGGWFGSLHTLPAGSIALYKTLVALHACGMCM